MTTLSSPDPALSRVRIPKAAELIANSLRRRIVSGVLGEDASLPAEGQLAQEFAVARATIREALRILEAEGLVIVRRGLHGGARVRTPSIGASARYAGLLLQHESTTLADVHRARVMIEAPIAGMLAERSRDRKMMKALRDALAEEAASLEDPVQLVRLEGRFHQELVRLLGNQTTLVLTQAVNHVVHLHSTRYMSAHQQEENVTRRNRQAHRAHERLVELIAAGSATEAEELWRKHLEAATALLLADHSAQTVLDLFS